MAVSLPMTLLVRILCLAIFAGLLPMRVSAASPITIRDCADCPELVVVPRGRFMMGSDDGEVGRSEGPIHEVAIRAFALARTEVTVADFRKFVAATGYQVASGCRVQASTIVKGERVGWEERSDAGWQAPGFIAPLTEDMPVVCVGHGDARAYAAWLSRVSGKAYRLPSEAEWEYAARAGASSAFAGGAAEQACVFGNVADQTAETRFRAWDTIDCNDGQIRPTAVGSYQANAWGLRDMIGNASEWTATCWDSVPGTDDSAHANCGSRVVRGGSWDTSADGIGFADAEPASREGDDRGLRLLREL